MGRKREIEREIKGEREREEEKVRLRQGRKKI
jgi:hypothetical protein